MATAVQIGRKLLSVLRVVHEAGVVHRDVTPNNILWDGEEAFLIDFGLAVILEEVENEETTSAGTPLFVTIQCLCGVRPSPLDDLQGLLFTLVYLTKGSLPWKSDTNV